MNMTRTLGGCCPASSEAARGVASLGLFATLAAVRTAWQAYIDWRECRHAIDELRQMDDRRLRDLGIARSEIAAAVMGLDGDLRRRRSLNE